MSEKGCYHLLFSLPHPRRLRIGALGTHHFPAGWYLYTGSAFGPGGLAARVARHRRGGRPHWHIDYLAAAARLEEVRLMPEVVRRECAHAAAARALPGASVPVSRFGASDCRCPAHLVHFGERPATWPETPRAAGGNGGAAGAVLATVSRFAQIPPPHAVPGSRRASVRSMNEAEVP